MNAITTTQDTPAPFGAMGIVPHNMDEALRLAAFMAKARTVPKHLQDSPGDCLMVIEQAMRWRMSPFAVAQATSVISGKMMYEGKLVAAAVETSGAIVGQMDYEHAGEGDARTITVSATRRGETNPRTVTVALKDAKTGNDMWKRQPDQQLVYHGVRVWARRWAPAVILGVYSREEMGPIIEGEAVESLPPTQAGAPASPERQAINDAVPLKPAAAATPRGARKVDPTVYDAPASKPHPMMPNGPVDPNPVDLQKAERTDAQWRVWLDKLRDACAVLYHRKEVVEVAERPSVADALANGPEWVRSEISAVLAENYKRFAAEDEPPEEELPEVEIEGEAKVAAG